MDESIRILIVDDHEVVRRGLHGIMSACEDMQVVGAAASGEEAVSLAKSVDPDVVLLDLQLPGMHGLEVIPELAERHDGRPKIIVLTVHDDDEIVLRAVKAGASGYVLKHASADELVRVIRHVAHGGRDFDEVVVKAFLSEGSTQGTWSCLRRTSWRSSLGGGRERPIVRWGSTSSSVQTR